MQTGRLGKMVTKTTGIQCHNDGPLQDEAQCSAVDGQTPSITEGNAERVWTDINILCRLSLTVVNKTITKNRNKGNGNVFVPQKQTLHLTYMLCGR